MPVPEFDPALVRQRPSNSGLLGVRCDVGNEVCVAFNQKIEAPVQVDAGLPDAFSFVVLLGLQRRWRKFSTRSLLCLSKAFCTAAGAAT